MYNVKTAALVVAGAAALVISAASFASEYSDAVHAAKSNYRDAAANCRAMVGDARRDCFRTAKATEKDALRDARMQRHEHHEQRMENQN